MIASLSPSGSFRSLIATMMGPVTEDEPGDENREVNNPNRNPDKDQNTNKNPYKVSPPTEDDPSVEQ